MSYIQPGEFDFRQNSISTPFNEPIQHSLENGRKEVVSTKGVKGACHNRSFNKSVQVL